jgi:hypothetical protein
MRILTVLARHGVEKYSSAEEDIQALFDRQLPDVQRGVIVVDNALPIEVVEQARGRTLLGGDNSLREFTAFDRALAWAGPGLSDYDLVHFATSAFNTLYTRYLDCFTPAVLAAAARRNACVGHIDCYNQPVRVRSFLSQHWIRTCFFFLRPVDLRALGSMVSIADRSQFFSGDPSSPFRSSAPLCPTYRQYIVDWLTGGDIGQGVKWHSTLALTAEALPSFEQKALCILNEQMLGIRLRALGCPLVDVTWLSARIADASADEIPWSVPWHRQLATRERDALILRA